MAYGTKYRLDFSDTEGNKRRLDILQKNYDGYIYPLIGTGSPASIKWEQDNDFYDPIIASNCEINLIQTDSVTYEEFYDFDEREFLVRLYYSETRVPYWEDENENWEAANQTWDLLGQGYNPADEWQNVNVVWDANNGVWEGGTIVDNYELFWQGFLIQDTYQQKLSAAPFNVSFKAVDGLGLLKGIEFPIAPNNDVTLWECLHECLFETGFEADIYVKTNLKEENATAIINVFEDVIVNSSTYTDENTYKFSAAEVLYSILTGFNCRIFQANGQWVIINNADITTLSAITYRRYNYLGVYQSNNILGEIVFIPSDALPIGDDLLKETSGGLIEVSNTISLDRQLNYIPNGNFEDDFTNWVYDSEFVSIDTNGIKGYKSAKILGTTNAFEDLLSNTFLIKAESSEEDNTKFDFSFDVQMQNGGFQGTIARYFVYFQIVARFREYVSGAYTDNYQTFYYDQLTSVWTETPFVNSFVYSGRGEWLTYDKEITYNCPSVTANYKPYDISFKFSKPKKDAGGAHVAMFISGVVMNWQTLLYLDAPDAEMETLKFDAKNLETSNAQTTTKKLTNKLEFEDIYQGSSFNRFQKGYMAPVNTNLKGYVTKFLRSGDIASKFIEDLTAQQRINDNRLKMERFEGTLKKMDNRYPIQLQDRLFISFNSYVEPKVLVIDTLEYNVKANQYRFNSHLGEQETDVETVFNSSQISYPVVATNQCSTYNVQNNSLLDDVTIGYYDCEGNYQEFTVNPDSSSNDFCAETEPFRVSGTTAIEIVLVSEQCLDDLYYSLRKCSDDTTGWVTAQNTEQIALEVNDRVQDPSLVDYVVTGTIDEGTSVGTVTDTGEVGCPVPPSLTAFLRSTSGFPNPCGSTPTITAYHDGAGTYPAGGDKVYNTANLTSPLSSGSYLMANNFYISLFGGEPGEVTGVTECTAPIPLHYTLEKCSDNSTGWITGQETTEITLSNNDRVSVGSDLYIVTGTATTGTSVGTVTDTGEVGCPIIPTINYYTLEKCSDSSTGYITGQTTTELTLGINERVRDASFVDYIVTGQATSGTSVGNVSATGLFNCPVPPSTGTFVSVWDTRNISGGSTNEFSVMLGLMSQGNYNFSVDWGDGNVETIISYNNRTHAYAVPGIYEIRITGTIEGFRVVKDDDKIISIKQWGDLRLTRAGFSGTNFGLYFAGCNNLDLSQVTDVPNFTNTTNFYSAFSYCTTLTTINRINEWNIADIISVQAMFQECTNLNIDISNWDVTNVGNASEFMLNTSLTPTNLDAIYNGWGPQNVKNGVTATFTPTKYTSAGAAGRADLDVHWTLQDGGLE
jgi:surface protein